MDDLTIALSILESKDTDSFKEVRQNYRRLIKLNHPDSVDEGSMDSAIEKTKELNWAYEIICRLDMSPEDTFEEKRSTAGVDYSELFREFAENMKENGKYGYDFSDTDIDSIVKEILDEFMHSMFQKDIYWDGAVENTNAYMKRWTYSSNYYMWDPEYESWENFGWSIDGALSKRYSEYIKAQTGNTIDKRDFGVYDLFFTGYRNATFCLIQQEYVRPYYCTGKLVEQVGCVPMLDDKGGYSQKVVPLNDMDPKIRMSKRESLMGKKPFDFDSAVIHTRLKYAHRKIRKQAVSEIKAGDELEFVVLQNHPMYTSIIEVFNKKHQSIGLLSAEYGIAMSSLLLQGSLLLTGVATEDGAPEVNLFLTARNPIVDIVPDNRGILKFYEENVKRFISIQHKIHMDNERLTDSREYYSILLKTEFSYSEPVEIFDKLLFETVFHAEYKDLYFRRNNNNMRDYVTLPNDVVSFLCELIEMFSEQPELFEEIIPAKKAYCSRWDKYSIEIRKCKDGQYSLAIYENKLLIGFNKDAVKDQKRKAINKTDYLGNEVKKKKG